MLTGFEAIENKNKGQQTFNLSKGISPFQHDVEFTVTGWNMVVPVVDGKKNDKANPIPVLTTTAGDAFISMIIKPKITAEGKMVEPNGTFNKMVKEMIVSNKGKSD